jgi:transcriptional regulator with XRE-family HTH domain
MADSRGAQALRDACPNHGDQRKLAHRTGIPESTLSKIATGQSSPGRRYAALLFDAAGIELSWWDESIEPESPNDATPTEAA